MKSTEGHGLTDSAAVAEHEFMHHAEEDAGHGITDKVATAEYEFMHRVEQEEHEHEAELKRGLSNEAAEWEFDLIHGAERKLNPRHTPGHKLKHMLKKLVPATRV
ncbi:hypothetical protein UCREL1_2927 [Eutypa lata UCREL1]|uniref:Uncharacterized protein n=1 Tax=Eutypa lata (strain UCR-EL1) TaxID=1287681 RepID=M7TTQ4_EUTLA|nr:hypothetical protein UCREL1_2927 [Eutypa lata UCREL1]